MHISLFCYVIARSPRMLSASCWSRALVLQLPLMEAVGLGRQAESQLKSSTYWYPSSSKHRVADAHAYRSHLDMPRIWTHEAQFSLLARQLKASASGVGWPGFPSTKRLKLYLQFLPFFVLRPSVTSFAICNHRCNPIGRTHLPYIAFRTIAAEA